MSTESAHDVNADTTEAARKARALWEKLIAAQRVAHDTNRDSARAYRNGLLDAFAIVTGQDDEQIGEALQDAMIADHEVSLMHREDIP